MVHIVAFLLSVACFSAVLLHTGRLGAVSDR